MKQILVSGLATIDVIHYLDEFPVDGRKYKAKDSLLTGGGNALNSAIAISRLGGSATLLTTIGQDTFGDLILEELQTEKVKTHAIYKKSKLKTSYSSIAINKLGDRQIINYRSPDLDCSTNLVMKEKSFHAYLTDGRLPNTTLLTLKEARKRKKPGVLDGENPVCPNALKLASHIAFSRQGLSSFSNSSSIFKGLKIAQNYSNNWFCVTDGEEGVFFLHGEELIQLKPPKVTAVDTLGAGDVWHGAFTLALAHNQSPSQACIFANNIASKKCTKYGGKNGSPYKGEVKLIEETPKVSFNQLYS
tara:strand:- start:90 stop:998 length:909 start_codon:yes stop_codon:yes gene_type:complete